MSKRLENAVKLDRTTRCLFRIVLVVSILLFIKGAFVAAIIGGVVAIAINKLNTSYENKVAHYLAIGDGRPQVFNPRTVMPQER